MTDNKKSNDEQTRLKEQAALVEEVRADFKRRQEERRSIERSWQLNMNFLNGNQYCTINSLGEVQEDAAGYFWQEKRVFNYIAPAIDTRCCKLTGLRPKLTVRAASEDDDDRRSSKIASSILSAVCEDCNLDAVISQAAGWSEVCGTAFYKITWDSYAGNVVGVTADGGKVKDGKVRITAVSPFEIYPDNLGESLYGQPSIIHARAVPADDLYAAYGIKVEGRDVSEYCQTGLSTPSHTLGQGAFKNTVKHGYEVLIERYVRPNCQFPDGRLTIVAGDKLLYDGALPYINGEGGGRTYPFAVQYCIPVAGAFFGGCIVDRLIPVQRAYNAVKNRKHEFLNRIAMGTVAVEEGSVDTDELVEDGLAPGKILVYRQGGTPPQMLTLGTIPAEFTQEEERLVEEFSKISGTSDITQKANSFTSVTSATGLQLIIEQDEARLNVCYEQIKNAIKTAGKMVLRLYKQFASSVRLLRYSAGGDALALVSFKGSDITGDDVVLEADSDVNMTPARRRAALYDMLDKGLFSDENGKVNSSVKAQLLKSLGYNGYSGDRDLSALHRQRCAEENADLKAGVERAVNDYDDHAVHINEHTAYLLTEKLDREEEARICAHLSLHKIKLSEVKNEG